MMSSIGYVAATALEIAEADAGSSSGGELRHLYRLKMCYLQSSSEQPEARLTYRSKGLRPPCECPWPVAGMTNGIASARDLASSLSGDALLDDGNMTGTFPRRRALASQLLICSLLKPVLAFSEFRSFSVK